MSKLIKSLAKKAHSSTRYEGAVECSDFEVVSFREQPRQNQDRQSFSGTSCHDRQGSISDDRQSISESTCGDHRFTRFGSNNLSVNNLNYPEKKPKQPPNVLDRPLDRPIERPVPDRPGIDRPVPVPERQVPDRPVELTDFPQNHDQSNPLYRSRPGSARFRTTNGHGGARHGSSSSLSSASSVSSAGSYSNNITNGIHAAEHAELAQAIADLARVDPAPMISHPPTSYNQFGAPPPPKPKRPSTDRVKTTMAFYANKPSLERGAEAPYNRNHSQRQSSIDEEGGMFNTNHSSNSSLQNGSPHASSTTINSNASNCSQHGPRVVICKELVQSNKKTLSELLKRLYTKQTTRDNLHSKAWADFMICSDRLSDHREEYGSVCYKVRCCDKAELSLPQRIYLARIQCSTQQELHQSQKMTFENDYKISSSLPPHPNVAGSHARFQDAVPSNLPGFPVDPSGNPLVTDTTFVISDFLSDSNLRTFLRDNAHLIEYKVEEFEYSVCLLLLQLFRALHHLHDNKVVHRDLKLENVIIGNADHPGGGKRLCVTNFGYALHQQDKAEPFIVNLDDPNVRLGGNLHHLPPEILNPPDEVNELDYTKSDVFGAGCMIYEMLNLQNPFEADESLAMRNYTQADLPLIPKRSRYSYALDRLVCLLLRNKPSKRISAKRAGDLVEVMLWGPEELRGADRTAAEQMAAEWLEQQRAEMLSNLALKLAENFTPHGARVINNSGFSLEDELKCRFLRETSSRALTTNLYLLSQCQRGQRT